MKRKKNVRKPAKPMGKIKDDLVVNEDAVPYVTKSNKSIKKMRANTWRKNRKPDWIKPLKKWKMGSMQQWLILKRQWEDGL